MPNWRKCYNCSSGNMLLYQKKLEITKKMLRDFMVKQCALYVSIALELQLDQCTASFRLQLLEGLKPQKERSILDFLITYGIKASCNRQ